MKTELQGYANLLIEKYDSSNVTVLSGRPGSGKTYYVTKYLELDFTKKLLLASSDDCEHEYLNINNIEKVSYYETRWQTSILEKFTSLLNTLNAHVRNRYDVIILDNVLFDSYEQIATLAKICLQYPNTKFFILLDKVLNLKNEEYSRKF